LERRIEEFADRRGLAGLAAGDHQQRRVAEREQQGPQLVDRLLAAAVRAPAVARVAPVAADVAALQPQEMRRGPRGRAFTLDREEDFADAERGALAWARQCGR